MMPLDFLRSVLKTLMATHTCTRTRTHARPHTHKGWKSDGVRGNISDKSLPKTRCWEGLEFQSSQLCQVVVIIHS